jgi:hypothetical protein
MRLLNFSQYIKESEEFDSELRGYSHDEIIERITGKNPKTGEKSTGIMQIFPDKLRFGIPSDNLGKSVTYDDANGVIRRINDITTFYSKRGEDVSFYCWSIAFDGTWEATESLREKIDAAGGFGKSARNMDIKKMIEYFTENKEDTDNVASISIGIDAKSIREDQKKSTISSKKENSTEE